MHAAGRKRQRESDKARLACERYLSMGASRGLAKLVRNYPELVPGETLSLATAKYWSRKYGRPDRARVHDEQLAKDVHQQIAKQAVQERVDGIQLCDSILCEGLKDLEQHARRDSPLRLDSPQQARSLVSALMDTAKIVNFPRVPKKARPIRL